MLAEQPDSASVQKEIGARLAGRTMLAQNAAYEWNWPQLQPAGLLRCRRPDDRPDEAVPTGQPRP